MIAQGLPLSHLLTVAPDDIVVSEKVIPCFANNTEMFQNWTGQDFWLL